MSLIDREFGERAIVRGGILMLNAGDAAKAIHRARDLGIRVLGVDGFAVTADITQPMMEHSIDISATASGCWDRAIRFLDNYQGSELLFEVVLDD